MKLKQKLSVALLAGLVAVGPMTSKTFAAEVNPTTTQEEIQHQVSDYFAENPDFLSYATDDELANLPPDAPVVEFGSFEEFKQTMDQFQTDVHSYESAMEFRNTQIIIELFNGLMFNQNINDIITTDVLEQPGIKTAREFVQEQIENKRQRRLDWESKQKKK
ncbi:hypothetical protein ACSBO6_13105 [Bacillus sp. AL-1R]